MTVALAPAPAAELRSRAVGMRRPAEHSIAIVALPCDGCALADVCIIRDRLVDDLPLRIWAGRHVPELVLTCSWYEPRPAGTGRRRVPVAV